MPTVVSFIFRLDFDRNYKLMDAPGTCFQVIKAASKGYWDDITENPNRQFIAVRRRLDRPSRQVANFTVEATSISGQLENEEGFEFAEADSSEYLNTIDRTVSELMTIFEIKNINRVGIRIQIVDGEQSKDFEQSVKTCSTYGEYFVPAELADRIKIYDVSLTSIGELDHGIKFRITTGPAEAKDVVRFFANIPMTEDDIAARVPHITAADIDLFEENINFTGTSLKRWFKARKDHFQNMFAFADNVSRQGV